MKNLLMINLNFLVLYKWHNLDEGLPFFSSACKSKTKLLHVEKKRSKRLSNIKLVKSESVCFSSRFRLQIRKKVNEN